MVYLTILLLLLFLAEYSPTGDKKFCHKIWKIPRFHMKIRSRSSNSVFTSKFSFALFNNEGGMLMNDPQFKVDTHQNWGPHL